MRFDRTFILLAALFCASVVLGTYSFIAHGDTEVSTALYKAVQLFSANSGVLEGAHRTPPALEVARWMALSVTLGTFVAIVTTMFHETRTWLRLRFVRAHQVVCGAGEKGFAIVADLVADGIHVAVIEINEHEPRLVAMRKRGAMVIVGDAREQAVLDRARLDTASHLVCATGADGTNVAIAMTATKDRIRQRSSPLNVYVNIGDIGYRDILQHTLQHTSVLAQDDSAGVRLRTFNYSRNLSRRILERFPLEVDNDQRVVDDVHVVLPGLGELERALAVQTALTGHYRHERQATVHVLCRESQAAKRTFLKRYPAFERCTHLETHDLASSADFVASAAELVKGLDRAAFTSVFLCGTSQSEMFMEALLLKQLLGADPRVRVVLAANQENCFEDIVKDARDGQHALSRWVVFAPPLNEACGRDAVYNDALDRKARKIHEVWFQKNEAAIATAERDGDHARAAGLKAKATFKPWGQLSERQKDLNRFAADHIEVKIRAAGLDPGSGAALGAQWEALDRQTLDMLSRVEHRRWSAAMLMSGWDYAPQRDDARRLHDNLVPFDELPAATQDNDLEQVKATAKYFLEADR